MGTRLFVSPSVARQAALGALAQISQGAAPVGLVIVVGGGTGSISLAGAVVAAMWVTAGIGRPIQGQLMDTYGHGRFLSASGVVHAAALVVLTLLARSATPGALIVALGAVAGASLPPVSSSMRVVWAQDEVLARRARAFSLVYVSQSVAVLIGPLVIALVIAIASGAIALDVAAAITAAGTIAYAASIRPRAVGRPASHRRLLRSRGVMRLLAVMLLVGITIGALEVAAPALAIQRGAPVLGGVLNALMSVGGVAGALLYGSVRWRAHDGVRLPWLLGLATVASASLVVLPALSLVGLSMFVAGLGIFPGLIAVSLLLDGLARGTAAGFGWLSTASAGGTALGSALAGALGQGSGLAAAFAAAAVAAALALAVSAARRESGAAKRSAR